MNPLVFFPVRFDTELFEKGVNQVDEETEDIKLIRVEGVIPAEIKGVLEHFHFIRELIVHVHKP